MLYKVYFIINDCVICKVINGFVEAMVSSERISILRKSRANIATSVPVLSKGNSENEIDIKNLVASWQQVDASDLNKDISFTVGPISLNMSNVNDGAVWAICGRVGCGFIIV